MADVKKCQSCGAELPSNAPLGQCPQCLLKLGFDPVPEAPQEAPPVGTKVRYFGDYELLEEIARGGMGIVFKARQISLNRTVALKMILKGELASEAEVQRFHREAQAAANLDHPNIVPIYEVGEHEGQYYFSMRLVDGRSLAPEASGLRPPVRDQKAVARLMAKVARAVHHAHQRGILHRDIKPGNILIDAQGEPHVTDFGLAKRVDMPSHLTGSESVIGTPNYMSPEQARGQNKDLSTASDIWSLGAVLYHLLTGRPPFQAATAWETLKAVVEQEPVRPREISHQLDRDLETICLKCLEKDPQRRYGSAQTLGEDFERWLRQEPIMARRVTQTERVQKWCKRNPVMASLAAAVIVLAGLGFAGWLVAREKSTAVTGALAAKAKADQDAASKTREAAAILGANNDFLVEQAFGDTNNLRGPVLLQGLDEALIRQPTNVFLLQAKAKVLERTGRPDETLDVLSSASELAGTETNLPLQIRIEILLTRSRLLRQMGRQDEADTDYSRAGLIKCQEQRILSRDPQTGPDMLDLSPFFKTSLSSFFDIINTSGREAATTIREDVLRNTGVKFDLRGGLSVLSKRDQISHQQRNPSEPTTVQTQASSLPPYGLVGIAVNRRFLRLHVLHSIWSVAGENTKIGAYLLHYADGQIREIPIRYGEHVRDVWLRDPRPTTGAVLAWKGESIGTNKACRGVQFFKVTWENPRPEAEVRSIDLTATAEVSPILLGITVEAAKPDSQEF